MMNNVPFSDDELREAAKKVQDALLDTLPPPSECQHEFSPEFEAKMKKLCAKSRWRRSLKRAAKRVAMVFITVLVGVGTWLAVDTEARAAFFGWVKERYENYVVYRFPEEAVTGDSMVPTNGKYQLAEVPEGYSLSYLDVGTNNNSMLYENEAGDYLTVLYSFDTEVSALYVFTSENGTFHQTTVDGHPADYVQSNSPEEVNTILWVDDNNTSFAIAGFFTEDELVEMAEGIHWVEEEPVTERYHLGLIPEGYTLFDEGKSGNMNSTVYSNEDGYILAFNYAHSTEATDWFMLIDGTTNHKIKVNGYPADFFLSHDPDVSSSVAWIGENDTLFRVKGFLSEEELIEIAESIEVVEQEVAEPVEYRLGWVPEGLTERHRVNDGNSIREVYADEQGRLLKFYCIFDDPSSYALYSYMEEPIIETVDVNGYAAEVRLSSSGEEGNTISWTTEDNCLFYISAFLDKAELVQIAENILEQ